MEKAKRKLDDLIVTTHMNDGTEIILRTIRPEDGDLLREGIAKLSKESRYLRFFSVAPKVPDAVVDKLLDVDGVDHIAWGAICTGCEETGAIGAVHAVRHKSGSGGGEYSVAVLDRFHGQGVARILTAALLLDCLEEEIYELDVYILTENRAAAALVKSMGAVRKQVDAGVTDYILDVKKGIEALKKDQDAPGLKHVFEQLDPAEA